MIYFPQVCWCQQLYDMALLKMTPIRYHPHNIHYFIVSIPNNPILSSISRQKHLSNPFNVLICFLFPIFMNKTPINFTAYRFVVSSSNMATNLICKQNNTSSIYGKFNHIFPKMYLNFVLYMIEDT